MLATYSLCGLGKHDNLSEPCFVMVGSQEISGNDVGS